MQEDENDSLSNKVEVLTTELMRLKTEIVKYKVTDGGVC